MPAAVVTNRKKTRHQQRESANAPSLSSDTLGHRPKPRKRKACRAATDRNNGRTRGPRPRGTEVENGLHKLCPFALLACLRCCSWLRA
jgi:hypothetical protein